MRGVMNDWEDPYDDAPWLTEKQLEILAFLAEELGEVQQIVGKILRHGYYSVDPTKDDNVSNKEMLETELADVFYAINLLDDNGDIVFSNLISNLDKRKERGKKYFHHQEKVK